MPKVAVVKHILAENETLAREITSRLAARKIRSLNLMSSPGSGKTALLEQTIRQLAGVWRVGVIEGDITTTADAERVEAAGAQAVQIETAGTCHLEAHMILSALTDLDLDALDLLVIENIGNLVCPAGWNLGEERRAVVISTTEGADKPAKYPQMFAVADVVVINKIDLLPYVDFDCDATERYIRAVNPAATILRVSCRTGEGIADWLAWLRS